MKSYKVITIIVLLMAIFTLIVVPIEEGVFPTWIGTDLIKFMGILLICVCLFAMVR